MAFFLGNKQADDAEDTAKNTFYFALLPKHVLVTGSNGQLGSELRRIAEQHDNSLRFFFTDVDTLDITNQDQLDAFVVDNNIKYIVNCAAYTAVDKAEDDIDLCYKINRDAVLNIARVSEKHGVKVIHVSTDYVFDGTAKEPYTEDQAISPRSVYGQSKSEGEQALFDNCSQAMVIRTAWLYSIYGNNFVKTMLRLGRERDSLNVVADQIGTPTNAQDLAEAIVHILDFSEANTFVSGIYHYSNMGITTWYDFTVEIHCLAGITSCVVTPISTAEYPTRAVRPQYSVLDKSKIQKTFNLSIPKWEDSLKRCIQELEGNN